MPRFFKFGEVRPWSCGRHAVKVDRSHCCQTALDVPVSFLHCHRGGDALSSLRSFINRQSDELLSVSFEEKALPLRHVPIARQSIRVSIGWAWTLYHHCHIHRYSYVVSAV